MERNDIASVFRTNGLRGIVKEKIFSYTVKGVCDHRKLLRPVLQRKSCFHSIISNEYSVHTELDQLFLQHSLDLLKIYASIVCKTLQRLFGKGSIFRHLPIPRKQNRETLAHCILHVSFSGRPIFYCSGQQYRLQNSSFVCIIHVSTVCLSATVKDSSISLYF